MRTRTILACLAVSLAGATLALAADAHMGTWNLNEAKSKFVEGNAARNTRVVYEAAGDDIKVTVDGVDKDGKTAHNEWTGRFDGKDYALHGDSTGDSRAYKKVDAHTLAMTIKKDAKVTMTGRITVAADGKSRTVATSWTDAAGKKLTSTAVYDKQ